MKKYAFCELAKTHKSVRVRLRYSALAYFEEGKSRADIAKFLKLSRITDNTFVWI